MDNERLSKILNRYLVVENETNKDFICHCPLCGDHPNPSKRGHLYVSKIVTSPYIHCFLCRQKMSVNRFIRLITGDKILADSIISSKEIEAVLKEKRTESAKLVNFKQYIVPQLDIEKFGDKTKYMTRRTNNKLDITKIPNLIFDLKEFLSLNKIALSNEELEHLEFYQSNMVIFLSQNNTRLFMRNIDKDHYIKMKKIVLHELPYDLLDYYCIKNNEVNSNIAVLCEGNFDLLGEYATDSLGLKNKAFIYAAGQSFSYSSLLRSLCFFECRFKMNVVILSDTDKKEFHYYKFLKLNKDIINSVKFYYNKNPGGDFGSFPIVPFEVKIYEKTPRIKY